LQYSKDIINSKILGTSIAFIIVAVNVILKLVTIKLVEWVGEDTESCQKALITKSVFYAQFFNTGFLILIVNANLTEHDPHGFTKYFDGPFTDYMPQWYLDVGLKILQTLVINSIMPIVGVCVGFGVPLVKQKLDNRFTNNVYMSKSTSMGKFKAIYSGVEYLIHFKYSDFLNITYISMMYGLGIPLLFPVASLNFALTWAAERTILAYVVRQPPAMDDKMTKNALSMIKFAPLFLLCNGYWMLSNREIFMNVWDWIDDDN